MDIHLQAPPPGDEELVNHEESRPLAADARSKTPARETPAYVFERVTLDWQPVDDHVTEVQQAVTLFERALVEFVQRQLEGFYGSPWLSKGCSQYLPEWEDKDQKSSALKPRSLLGYAEIGDLKKIIVGGNNWQAFKAYFSDKQKLQWHFDQIVPLRVGGAHASQRQLYLIEQIAGLNAMIAILNNFSPPTADAIDDLVQQALQAQVADSQDDSTRSKVLSNLGDFSAAAVIGREQEMHKLEEFWRDDFQSVMSIVGEGGIGKTALLDSFLQELLSRPCPVDQRPTPEAVIYLTAKDNYLADLGQRRAPPPIQFHTLARILEVTIETISGEQATGSIIDQRRQVQVLARQTPILFLLDNLETLVDPEWEEIGRFLDSLATPSKAILTTRITRRVGETIRLQGLTIAYARELLLGRLASLGIEPAGGDLEMLDALVGYTGGFPLAVVWAGNAIVNGYTVREALEKLRGAGTLEFLQFSFESSIKLLAPNALQMLLLLALSKHPRSRREMLKFASDDADLDGALLTLSNMSFINRSWEVSQTRFSVDNSQLRDYVRKRAPEILSTEQYAGVLREANVLPAQADSPSVSIEVERAVRQAKEMAARDWNEAIEFLEAARRTWGDDPRLLGQLGYYYFRIGNRRVARTLLERALSTGLESADVYANLALVLFYDREYEDAARRSESALTLRANFPMADQIAGQCYLSIANRDSLTLDDRERRDLLERALRHLERSLLDDERGHNAQAHNRRSTELIQRVQDHLALL